MGSGLRRANCGWTVATIFGLISLLGVVFVAGAGNASEIVDLRIGAHKDFTRVVLELDRPAGFRIERASPKPGVSDLVISIDATSIPRKVQTKNDLIGLVQITPRGSGALAEIRLAREGLRLKEMILSSPPRIVVDILAPEPTKNKAKTAPTASVVPSSPKPEAKQPVAPKPTPQDTGPTQVASSPTDSSKAPPRSKAKPPRTETKDEAVAVRTTPPMPSAKVAKPPAPTAYRLPETEQKAVPEKRSYARTKDADEPIGGELALLELEAEEVVRAQPAPTPSRQAQKLKALKERNQEPESGNWAIWATLIGAVAMTILLLAMRRRRAAASADEFDEGVEVGGSPAGAENPFANRTRPAEARSMAMSEEAVVDRAPDLELEVGDLVDDPEKEEALVEGPFLDSREAYRQNSDTEIEGLGAEAGLVPADEEMKRMLSEFQQRMESMERRLDEVSEARERLERQVAAQTEELRVQRAAIARTQRAVRNMNRPDADGPTEPTPRES